MKICIETAQLQNKGNDILLLRDELIRNMERIETLVLSISGSWQGDAERVYASQILYVKKEFEAIIGFLGDYAALLAGASEQYKCRDEDLAAKISLV